MDKLYLIGNGFDLAHGLKTSYGHFILDYLKMVQNSYNNQTGAFREYEDEMIQIKSSDLINTHISQFSSLKEFLDNSKNSGFKIDFQNKLLKKALMESGDGRWVDFEYLYFRELILDNNIIQSDRARRINQELEDIKQKLEKYLAEKIESKLDKSTGIGKFRDFFYNPKVPTCILNFNYTSTIYRYLSEEYNSQRDFRMIQIHGKIGDLNSPIVFGYGDDYHEMYQKISNLNNNEYLRNLKSFWYLRNRNYLDFMGWIENSNGYSVHIIGHSCGLSDRTLLKEVFENKKCRNIYIHHHESIDNHIEVGYEISRHFTKQVLFREKVMPFSEEYRCPQYND